MHTLGYRFRPWTDAKAIADGDSILDYVRETAREERDRPQDPLQPPRRAAPSGRAADARWTVEAERTDSGETVQLTCGFLCVVQRLLPLRRGLHAGVPRDRALRRRGRPPAALARGPRLRRQAGRRDRQRRHRGDAGAGDGREGRARDDAAALADLRRLDAGRGPDRQRRCAAVLPDQRRLRDRALEERAPADGVIYQLSREPARARQEDAAQGRVNAAARRLRRRHPLQAPLQPLGPARSAWSPTPTSSRRSRAGGAEIVTDRIETFTENGIKLESGERAGGRRDHHRHRPQPALPRRHGGRRRRRASRLRRDDDLQGDDAQRRPQLRLHARLHQRLLDAQGRPHLRIRLPPAQPHGRARLHAAACREISDPSITEEPLLDFNSGYVLRSLDKLPKQGSKEPWKLRQNYPLDLRTMRRGPIDDGAMRFSTRVGQRQAPLEPAAG